MATKEQRRRNRRRRTPIAAPADRSQKERDKFFGGKPSAISGSKSTRGYRPVGKDIRSDAAKAAAGRSLGKATLRPSEVAEADRRDRLDKIAEGLSDKNKSAPDKPKGFLESVMGQYPKFTEAYKGMAENRALNKMLQEKYPTANQSFKGMDSVGQTVLEDAPESKGFLESVMDQYPKLTEAYKGMAENRALNEMMAKEMNRAEMSKNAADFLGYMEDKPVENPASRYEARGKGDVDMKTLNLNPLEKKPKKSSEKTFLERTIHNLFNPMKNEFR